MNGADLCYLEQPKSLVSTPKRAIKFEPIFHIQQRRPSNLCRSRRESVIFLRNFCELGDSEVNSREKMKESSIFENGDLNLQATELKLGLPGRDESSARSNKNKRASPETNTSCTNSIVEQREYGAIAPKGQVVGWPPVRSFRKNPVQSRKTSESEASGAGVYVKVSMDGAPYLRKIDLKLYSNYNDLLTALESMFKCTIGRSDGRNGCGEYTPTYEDKDGDWMLVGDVPWEMFTTCCRRLRMMKGCEATPAQESIK